MSADSSHVLAEDTPLERACGPRVSVQVSATVPNWSREAKSAFEWAPSRSLLASIRAYQRHVGRRNPVSLLLKKLAVLRHRFWSVVTGSDIPLKTQIGGGL